MKHTAPPPARFRYPQQLIAWRASEAGNVMPMATLPKHPANGLRQNDPRALAGLAVSRRTGALGGGLARAYALQGDTGESHTAYQDFSALWKDADPDIPVLKEAKAEYGKLQ